MAYKFEIVNNAFKVTNTVTSDIVTYLPIRDVWFNEYELSNNKVYLYGVSGHPINNKPLDLTQCVDESDVAFTEDSLRNWFNLNVSPSALTGASILFENETASLLNGTEVDTGWLLISNVKGLLLNLTSDNDGLTLVQSFRNSDSGDITTLTIPLPTTLNDYALQFPARSQQTRFQIQNNSGATVTNVKILLKATEVQPTITPLAFSPLPQSQALLSQSVIIGQDAFGSFTNSRVNEAGALLVSDFGTEVARELYQGYQIDTKFGRNADIDTGTTPEDVWNGGGSYTGFNCVTAETLNVVSSSANDLGTLVSSGTATGGSSTTLVDSGATFVTDGVVVGDMIINDTQSIHAIVSEVTSETTLTFRYISNGANTSNLTMNSGDSYRIASNGSTGASVVKLKGLDADYNGISEYVILNGTTNVTTTKSFIRQSRAAVELAGTNTVSVGEITARQSVTTANITMVMPADSGQTAICCATVPAGKNWVIKDLNVSMVIDGNQSGSAQMQFQIRERGGAWQTKRFQGITNSNGFQETLIGGLIVEEQSDIRWRIQSVSNNNTQVTGLFEYFQIEKL